MLSIFQWKGHLLITALASFAITIWTDSLYLGYYLQQSLVGFIAFIIVWINFRFYINQIAVGFIFTIFLWKLSSYLGGDFVRIPGPYLDKITVPDAK